MPGFLSRFAGLVCFLLGHRFVCPPDGGAFCTRCHAATDWRAWDSGRQQAGG